MIAKPHFVFCVLLMLPGNDSLSQEYTSHKLSYDLADKHSHLMIGVGSESQQALVTRLTGGVGQTFSLESPQEGAYFSDSSDDAYHRINERALKLRSADVIFVVPHPHCSTASLWYERLANHGVRVIELRPVSAVHRARAAQSLTRQIYLGFVFNATDIKSIDQNFCSLANELKKQGSPTDGQSIQLQTSSSAFLIESSP